MTARGGSALRAWLVAHDAVALAGAITAVTVLGSGYAWLQVPSVHGGPIPVWLLVPPALALFAGLGAGSSLPALIWVHGTVAARLGWACGVSALAGAGGAVVGSSAGQPDLGRSAVILSGLVFGCSVVLGRCAPLVAAVPLVGLLVQVHAVRDVTPERLWSALSAPQEVGVLACWSLAVLAYARWGDGRSAQPTQ